MTYLQLMLIYLYRVIITLLLLLTLCTCGPATAIESQQTTLPNDLIEVQRPKAQHIVQASINAAALIELDSAALEFTFRDKTYRYQKAGGRFVYERYWRDTTDGRFIRDVLHNDEFVRYIDGERMQLTTKQYDGYSSSVNSVIYFAFLPYALLDPAAQLTYLGTEPIKGATFDKIGVGFEAAGGGKDYEDSFLYWFEPETHRLRYLAYVEAGNKAPRFREAFNERVEAGITVRDYRNYHTVDNAAAEIGSLVAAFNGGQLPLLSTIAVKNVRRVPVATDRLLPGTGLPE